ncbi:uncharacterized protein LOC142317556 [Lycorma delicatula]|uniref:uncharacterized protein LOC142317556 n=1 Tax=Lycorma delicatula TaxID=130591 RepID=UPI003F51206F
MNQTWKNEDTSLGTKCRLVHTIIFLITINGYESWTLKREDRRRIDAFELWCCRRMLRIPWAAKITNRAVLERVKPAMFFEGKVLWLKLLYFGHIMQSNLLEKSMMLGMVSGKRRVGRPRTRWLDTVKAETGMAMKQLKEAIVTETDGRNLSVELPRVGHD